MVNKLKPCPFCGGIPQVYVEVSDTYNNYSVSCKGCGCETMSFNAEQEAIVAWNICNKEDK